MPTDIFPFINTPVVSVIWSYNGLPAEEMENRITTICERAITTVTSDIDHIESSSLNGICVIKVYLRQGADVGKAVGTIASLCQTLLRIYPAGTTPPLITPRLVRRMCLCFQLGVGSQTLSEQELFDFRFEFHSYWIVGCRRCVYTTALLMVANFAKFMVDLEPQALQSKGLSATDVSIALAAQNVILPSGEEIKIGSQQIAVYLNSTPETIQGFNDLPIKQINGTTVYLKDVAHMFAMGLPFKQTLFTRTANGPYY